MMKQTAKTIEERLVDYWSNLILHAVTTKEHVYKALRRQMPYVALTVDSRGEDADDVRLGFGRLGSASFRFSWEPRPESSTPTFRKFCLKSIEPLFPDSKDIHFKQSKQ